MVRFPHLAAIARMAVVLFAALALASCGGSKRGAMVSTANPHASEAAIEILRKGGGAVDAAIAAQLVLTLVEPQSSGIGGGAFLMHWDAGAHRVEAYDGRETAPAAATPELFLNADGTPMSFFDAVVGGRAVGVPGVIAMLWKAHQDHGNLDWRELFQPAIRLAETGFKVSPRLNAMISAFNGLSQHPSTRATSISSRSRWRARWSPAGGLSADQSGIRRNAQADRRRRDRRDLRGQGRPRHRRTVRDHEKNPGLMSLEDLSATRRRSARRCAGHTGPTGSAACRRPPPAAHQPDDPRHPGDLRPVGAEANLAHGRAPDLGGQQARLCGPGALHGR